MVNLQLRDYQQETLDALAHYARGGGKRALVALPTGTGKTHCFAHLPAMSRKKVLVVAHRTELLEQAAKTLRLSNPQAVVEIEQAKRTATEEADIIVASIQTLTASGGKRLKRLNPQDFSVICVDEAHHTTAKTYCEVLAHFGLLPDVSDLVAEAWDAKKTAQKLAADALVLEATDRQTEDQNIRLHRQRVIDLNREQTRLYAEFKPDVSAPFLAGWTATPSRTDGAGLEDIYDDIVYSRSILEMMEEGWLCSIAGQRINTETDISGVRTSHGDFVESALSKVVNTPERNNAVVDGYLEYTPGEQALCFCVDVAHTASMLSAFEAKGVKAAMVVGETPTEERAQAIAAYQGGDIQVLVNCMVLTEGFDAPETSSILMARPTKSQLLFTQMLGRGTRTAEGKERLLVLDFVDISKAGVASVHSLFGLPVHHVTVPSIQKLLGEMEEEERRVRERKLEEMAATGKIDVLEQFVLNVGGSEFAWFKTQTGAILQLPDGAQLGIIENFLGFSELRFKEAGRPVESLGAWKRQDVAVLEGEKWVKAHRGSEVKLLDRKAAWRDRDDPTDQQLSYAKKLGVRVQDGQTKGQVSDLIDLALSREATEPATPRQVAFCNWKGIPLPENPSKVDAKRAIAAHQRGVPV